MGLMGGPHCLAMCAAPCHVVVQGHQKAVQILRAVPPAKGPAPQWGASVMLFHTGRMMGYGALGALAALAMEQVAWFADRTSPMHSIWLLMHLIILAWGMLMLLQGRQPAWLERAGRTVWGKVQPLLQRKCGVLLVGAGWALMPCGLLYSAILVAALSGAPWMGAVSMAAFAVGGALWLVAAPYGWKWISGKVAQLRAEWGVRAGGAMLVLVSVWALWMDLIYKPALWCR